MKRAIQSLGPLSLFYLLSILAAPQELYSQQSQWINYTNVDYITSIASYKNIIWIGARGGVVRFDPASMSKTIFTRADGLVTNDVQALAVGPDGSVWASGTWGNDGIGVYDGTNWSTVATGNSQAIGGIYKMQVAPDGTVWFNMLVGGLWDYRDGAVTKVLTDNSYIQSFAVDRSGGVWAADAPGVEHYDGNSWTQIDSSNSGLGSNTVSGVLADKFGRVWFSTDEGISMYDGTSWHKYTVPIKVNSASNLSLTTVDLKGNLWLTYSPWSLSPKILDFDGSQWQIFDSTSTGLSQYSRITCGCADSLGNVYFALVPVLMTQSDLAWRGGGQLLKCDGTKWETVDVHSRTLPFSPVYHFGLAKDGGVWMGTNENGAVRDDGSNWNVFDSKSNGIYPSNDVNGIASDQNQGVWTVGFSWRVSGSTMGKSYFEGGASYYDGTKWTTYNLAKGNFPSNDVECVAVDKNNNVWFGTYDKGVVKYDGSTWTTYDTSNSQLPSNDVNCCVVDSQNNIWFGTNNGVAKFDGASWTVRNSQNSGLPYDYISSMAVDKTGKIWFLDWNWVNYNLLGNYIVSYDGVQWNSWSAPSPAHCFCVDSTNSVWVGTYGNGVSKFNGSSWTTFTTANSAIGYNYIEGIMADSHGNIWMGAQDYGGGVSVYNPNGVTGVEQATELPTGFRLYQNYPNPFNPTTTIKFGLPKQSQVSLIIYDILGREVKELVNDKLQAGYYHFTWDATRFASGVYFYRIEAQSLSGDKKSFVGVKKLLLLK